MQPRPSTRSERRSLGRFNTPRPLAQALTDWGVCHANDTVLEPSCGGGVIVASILARLSELGAKNPARQIWACDVDPRALAETKRAADPHVPHFLLGNFLSASASEFGTKKFSVILGNPPYVRLHTMDDAARDVARKSLPTPNLLDAKASLWAYFPIHAFKMLATGGRMGWIVPETVLHAEYGKQFLVWAKQNFQKCVVVSLRERCFLADGAKERVVVLLLEGAGGQAAREIEMIEFTSANECITVLPGLGSPGAPALPQLNGHAVPHLISNFAAQTAQGMETAADLKRFGDYGDVKIGVVTGDNHFFLLNEEQREAAGLKPRHFQRVVSKFADLGNGFNFAGTDSTDGDANQRRGWMLCPSPTSVDKQLAKYLDRYSTAEIASNKTMGKRSAWQVPQLGNLPEAFFQYMGKVGPRMVLNEAAHTCTNTIHRIFFAKNISKSERQAICLSVHSSYSQLSAEFEGRQYGSGVLKLEPSEVRRLQFPFNEQLASALSINWRQLMLEAAEKGWESVVPKIDALVVAHCPSLAKNLPVEEVRSLLLKVRQRRNSGYFSSGM